MKQTVEEQLKIILKGVSSCIEETDLKQKLEYSQNTGIPLIIKLGLDPSAPDIHLGHAVVLRKIKQMQDFGHKAVIVIGDFTGQIGDPTGKSKSRPALTKEKVRQNAVTYQEQIFKILNPEQTEVRFNSDWLSSLTLEEILKLASCTTVARMLERNDFQARYNQNIPIGIQEFFYPLMQGYDSIVLHADIELGGTDQTFNILMGRNLQKHYQQSPQTALFMPILEGLDGVEKMSKSLGNYIGIDEDAKTMFKKVMEVPDHLIIKYFTLATDMHPDEISILQQKLEAGSNPKDIKLILARTITELYHTEEEAKLAEDYFHHVFTKKNIPSVLPSVSIFSEKDTVFDCIPFFIQAGFIKSSSEFRRLAAQGGVQVNQEKLTDLNQVLYSGDVIKIGKKTFFKIQK